MKSKRKVTLIFFCLLSLVLSACAAPVTPILTASAPLPSSSPEPTIAPTSVPDGMLIVYPDQPLQTLRDVAGGNFIHKFAQANTPFEPVSEYNIQHLQPRVARIRMTLEDWEPVNDDIDPRHIEATGFKDTGYNHSAFLMMQALQKEGVLLVGTAWDLPNWLVKYPDFQDKRIVPIEKYPEIVEMLAAWLLTARDQYGVVVDYISINEANIGVNILLNSEAAAELVRQTGPRFEELGLKTKWLLGDAAGMDSTPGYAGGIWAAEDIRSYLGVLAFHSWDATTKDETLIKIANFAEANNLEVWCTEAGYNASAWQTPDGFPTWDYAFKLAQIYTRLLKLTRATTLLYWEMMGTDYNINDGMQPFPSMQYLMALKAHFPTGSVIVNTSPDPVDIKWVAARVGDRYVVEIINRDSKPRLFTLLGLPDGLYQVRVMIEEETPADTQLEVKDGQVGIELPPGSILFIRRLP